MERIKQALERARAERQQHSAGSAEGRDSQADKRGSPRTGKPRMRLVPQTVEVSWPRLNENRVVGGPEASALVDTYRVLRTQILQRLNDRGARTLGVTSANAGEGKSLTAVNLAVSLARKVPVLLVDADMRRPSLHRFLGIKPAAGLADYLASDINNVENCLFRLSLDGLTVLLGGSPCANSSELLMSAKMFELMDEAKRSDLADIIVFDLPPLLTTDDALAFSRQIDAVLLVVEEGRSLPGELKRATELLAGTYLIGTVLNKSSEPFHTYY